MARHRMRARREAAELDDADAPAPRALRAAPNADALAEGLERAIDGLDRLAQDPAYTADEQRAFARQAAGLRRRAAAVDAAEFDAGTAKYAEAVAALGAVNQELGAAQGRIAELPAALGRVSRVAGVLDDLLATVG